MATAILPDTIDASLAPHLNITAAAAAKVHALIQEEGEPNLKLRVYITGGGCSGFQYGFSFVEDVAEDDHGFIRPLQQASSLTYASTPGRLYGSDGNDGNDAGAMAVGLADHICVLVDMMSFHYLLGASIDYQEDVNGARFVVSNPNAKTTCGCGSSFSA
jgi:iron-sulfur cluster insertion protein